MRSDLNEIAALALSSRQTVQSSYDIARLAIENAVPGDFVECGVFAGAQCAAMGRAIMESGEQRRVHLFDSFQGIPAGSLEDLDWAHPAGTSKCDIEQVKAYMRHWGVDESLLCYHPGWFENTIQYVRKPPCIDGIAVLRLDADLYEPTRIALKYLYPLVTRGGWLIIDDMSLYGCRTAVMQYFNDQLPPVYFQVHG